MTGTPQQLNRRHAPPHTPEYPARGTRGYEAGTTEVNVGTTPPTVAEQAPPGDPDSARVAPPAQATVQAQCDPGDATSTTDGTMTESRGSGTSKTTPAAAAQPSPVPSQFGPNTANMHTEPNDDASGNNPSRDTLAARDREIMPPPASTPPHAADNLDLEELRRVYGIYHRNPSQYLVDALRVHFQGFRGDWRFASALLPHKATNIRVWPLQALLTLEQQTPDDLIDV